MLLSKSEFKIIPYPQLSVVDNFPLYSIFSLGQSGLS